jgi:secreted trypsin-like serine protease
MLGNLLLITLAISSYVLAEEIERIKITPALLNSTRLGVTFIVGGKAVTSASAYPFAAGYLETDRQFCGASLISDEWALTAAHCIGAEFPRADTVSVGSLRHDGLGTPSAEYFQVEQTFMHPNWNPNILDYDAALLKLSTKVPFDQFIQPIKLAPSSSGDFSGTTTTVVGWGTTTEGGSPSAVLREVDVPIISNTQCSNYYDGITPRMVCAYEPGKDSCQGDSGGPLFLPQSGAFMEIGIVSWGIGCARVGYPGVYTRVSTISDWVCSTSGVC